jgi:hypothetical protein
MANRSGTRTKLSPFRIGLLATTPRSPSSNRKIAILESDVPTPSTPLAINHSKNDRSWASLAAGRLAAYALAMIAD